MEDAPNSSWVSDKEIFIGPETSDYLRTLREIDGQIHLQSRAKYVAEVLPRLSFGKRAFRKLVRIIKNFFLPLSRFANQYLIPRARRKFTRRLPLVNGQVFNRDGVQLEVQNLDQNLQTLTSNLSNSSATHWLLVHKSNQLRKGAIDKILSAVSHSDAQVWYGDSIGASGHRIFRPEFSTLLLRQVDFMGPIVIVAVETLRAWRAACECPHSLWPLGVALWAGESEISLIPEVIGIETGPSTPSLDVQLEAVKLVSDSLETAGLDANVIRLDNWFRSVEYTSVENPLISIIIPTRGTANEGVPFVYQAVKSILHRTNYENYEILIVADEPTPQWVVSEIDALESDRITWIRWDEPFNFSKKMNLGAAMAKGEYLLFLNDDVEVVSSGWISSMHSLIGISNIEFTGAVLFFDDGTVQHGGHLYAGGAGHIGFRKPFILDNPTELLGCDRITSGITAACSLIRKSSFERVGGFSEDFANNYNDVDLCLKVREHGGNTAVAGAARLYHFESKTRDSTVTAEEIRLLNDYWGNRIYKDHYWRAG